MTLGTIPAPPEDVAAAFGAYPPDARARLFEVRETLFDLATQLQVGPLTETLKWGEPAYLTEVTKAGSTVRLAWSRKAPDAAQVLFICSTRLVDAFRTRFGDDLDCVGNRAIHLPLGEAYAKDALAHCLAMALTYKRRAVFA